MSRSDSGTSYDPELDSDQSDDSDSETDNEESQSDEEHALETISVEDYVRVSLSFVIRP